VAKRNLIFNQEQKAAEEPKVKEDYTSEEDLKLLN